MEIGLVITDRHHDADKEEHPSYTLVKQFAQSIKPDFVVDLGDLIDMSYISSFNEAFLRKLENKRYIKDIELVNRELDFWQGVTNEYIQLEGNHDYRVKRWADKVPSLEGLIEYETVFDFKGRGIQWVWSHDQPYRRGKLSYHHGRFCNKYAAAKHLDVYMCNMVFGHIHKHQVASKVIPGYDDEIQAWGLGCLCDVEPEYAKNQPLGHQNQFAVVEQDEKGFNLYPVNIIKGQFRYGGRTWGL
jgi:predicted phosphodiesterase